MGTTAKGIVYPSNYSAVADLPTDLQTMANSIDTALDNVVIPVDSALSPTSENPVQNKVITANIEDLEEENAELKNIIDQIVPTTTQEGTDITLQNTLDAKLKSIIPKGNTSQDSYSGKNLVGLTNGTYTNGTITAVVSNGIITLNGTASADTLVSITASTNYSSISVGDSFIISLNNPVANSGVLLRLNAPRKL